MHEHITDNADTVGGLHRQDE